MKTQKVSLTMTTPKKTKNEQQEPPVATEEVVDGEQSTMPTPDADFDLDEATKCIDRRSSLAIT